MNLREAVLALNYLLLILVASGFFFLLTDMIPNGADYSDIVETFIGLVLILPAPIVTLVYAHNKQ